MKQTAVEWLEEELAKKLKSIVLNQDYQLMETLFEQALAMEKEQIEASYYNGFFGCVYDLEYKENYYNETYGTPSVKG